MRTNVVYEGDCLRRLAVMPEASVDLIYADPPFFTQQNYEQIWRNADGSRDEYEVRQFHDRWAGGIENYISWMEPRLRECHRVLKPTGAMYLHCDWHANAHLRVVMDKIFEGHNFRNEIVWHYRGRGMQSRAFQRKHDTILFYARSETSPFYQAAVLVPYDPDHVGRYDKTDPDDGRKYALIKKRNGPHTRVYLKEGVVPDDVWDIPFIHGAEAVGWPTQKPEALLERMIAASSAAGDVVLDPFCGCGTAIAVAQKTGRRWVGIDVSPVACRVMKRRLDPLLAVEGKVVEIVASPHTVEALKGMNPYDFQRWCCEALHATPSARYSGDLGIDGHTAHGGEPVQVKQSERVGRNVVDNFKAALDREGKRVGIVVAFSFGRGAVEETSRLRNLAGGAHYDIRLRTAEELLAEQ